ncbi:hypothetical protein LaP1706_gp24 [Lactococcus phage 1706]|uniref:Uncharacterized protein n=1 Tax=Lactococcus phage 1706 TaxID=475178 RepID=B2BTI8_9CAUD|nr:hypothetical protein LaP1706_gp24 [Lactococcus phage 1706]ABV91231.1 unknown [Lactococcus phage 1706]
MKIIETYKLQKKLMDTYYEGLKDFIVNEQITNVGTITYLEEIGKISNTLLDMRSNSKVNFWLATILTNLDINVWHKALSIRKMRKEINL